MLQKFLEISQKYFVSQPSDVFFCLFAPCLPLGSIEMWCLVRKTKKNRCRICGIVFVGQTQRERARLEKKERERHKERNVDEKIFRAMQQCIAFHTTLVFCLPSVNLVRGGVCLTSECYFLTDSLLLGMNSLSLSSKSVSSSNQYSKFSSRQHKRLGSFTSVVSVNTPLNKKLCWCIISCPWW